MRVPGIPALLRLWRLIPALFLLASCTSINPDTVRPISQTFINPADTPLGQWYPRLAAPDTRQSAFTPINTGRDALAARLALIDQADKTLDMQYYMLRDDSSTQLLIHHLLLAADRGVRIRLLIDDIYGLKRDYLLATLSAHPRIEIRVFNPFLARGRSNPLRVFEFIYKSSLNKRMHNKLLVADNAAMIVGGRNLGNEYFESEAETAFTDLDVLALGPAVQQASLSFDEYWNHPLSIPIRAFQREAPSEEHLEQMRLRLQKLMIELQKNRYPAAFTNSAFAAGIRAHALPFSFGEARLLYDRPQKVREEGRTLDKGIFMAADLYPEINKARKEVLLVSPYFVPGPRFRRLLVSLTSRGVRVRILTNSLAATDVPFVHGAYARWRAELLRRGVEFYELRPLRKQPLPSFRLIGSSQSSLHAKAFIVDRRVVFIGSMNLDQRSFYLNTETGLLVESPDLAMELNASFERLLRPDLSYQVFNNPEAEDNQALVWWGEEQGKSTVSNQEPGAGIWRRMKAGLFGKLVPDRML